MRKRHRSSLFAAMSLLAVTGIAAPEHKNLQVLPPDSAGGAARRDAVEQVLVTLRSDPEGGIEHTLLLGFDAERRVERLVRRTGDDFETFSFEQTRNGATLASARGRDVIRLSCPACDSRLGGRVRIRYLSNGIFNSYDVLELDCRRGADDMLALFPLGGGQPIRRLRMTSRRFLGILIGIGAIQVESSARGAEREPGRS